MNGKLNTINGSISIDALGKTLMHEHLVIGLPGWDTDTWANHRQRPDLIARCVDLVQELQDHDFKSLLDPCPNDIGRDLDLMGEVASRTGFNILFATGLYEDFMAGAFWRVKAARDPDAEKYITEMYIREIEQGVGVANSKPAVIKVATGKAPFTDYEKIAMGAAAAASVATGVPITTHTSGVDGEKQLKFLMDRGVSPERIIVGHCCGSNDQGYHQEICQKGAYIGFDRFGLLQFNSDENRTTNLVDLMKLGYSESVIVSHDCVFNMRGHLLGALDTPPVVTPMHFVRNIVPMLKADGISDALIESVLTANPRSFFEGRLPQKNKTEDN